MRITKVLLKSRVEQNGSFNGLSCCQQNNKGHSARGQEIHLMFTVVGLLVPADCISSFFFELPKRKRGSNGY